MQTLTRGWLLPKLVELEQTYQGRYELWRHTLKTGEMGLPEPTEFLAPGNPSFTKTLKIVNMCLDITDTRPVAL